jgi:hypothetical protein
MLSRKAELRMPLRVMLAPSSSVFRETNPLVSFTTGDPVLLSDAI